ncbi:secreted protein [Rhodopirellula sallentina SM41]|uniref:Secreted protein n=1 Tax=Rhodopirellula sallentina SM41 TaxID=1263870 RepID=M5TV41_9BACT|nr:secreted protein [Rhodopirellula sallentina SM41]
MQPRTTRKPSQTKSGKRKSSHGRKKPPIIAITAGGLFAALILFGIMFSLRTKNGMLVIENLPADAQVMVDQENVRLRWNDGKDSATVRIKPGTRQVEVLSGGAKIAGDTVTIESGTETSITVIPRTSKDEVENRQLLTSDNPTPRLFPLDELNMPGRNEAAWVSPDGGRIYWEHSDSGGGNAEIFQAERDDLSVSFGNERSVITGKQPTLTPDELQVVFVHTEPKKFKRLYMATRSTKSDRFENAKELMQFGEGLMFNSPCISADGLALFVNARQQNDIRTTKYYVSRRTSIDAAWMPARPVDIRWNAQQQDAPLTWISMAPDEMSFLATHEMGVGRYRVLQFSRTSKTAPFESYEYLTLPGFGNVYGRSPRYSLARNELFLTAPESYAQANSAAWKGFVPKLWAIRDVDRSSIAQAEQSLTLLPAGSEWHGTVKRNWRPGPTTKDDVIFTVESRNGDQFVALINTDHGTQIRRVTGTVEGTGSLSWESSGSNVLTGSGGMSGSHHGHVKDDYIRVESNWVNSKKQKVDAVYELRRNPEQ